MDTFQNIEDNYSGSIIQVTVESFDIYRNDIKNLIWENMMHHYTAQKVDEVYFETKTSEIKRYLAEQKAVIFVFINNGKASGCIWSYPRVFLDEKRLFVQMLQIKPEHRNAGIGKQLLNKIEEYAKAHGYYAVDMIAESNNNGAVRFYQREGYQIERVQLIKTLY